ncbi:hypothetical protein [Alkalihalobacillus pseudalcaliphilus]|uniref:hypothetical protein n=1 Tax=Alkalihalobacillus pseudalcaliphilus TaxID=79884 RepID=UPI00064E05F1|nr:hypothetical protein [Alkalihalobacillus pseudalcaliphilus]KMK78152.1 hypothetical protein AB990_01560 [Alkalihalobacillus pseudalcaliphilus]
MYGKYARFEFNLQRRNKKNLFLGLLLILFFVVSFHVFETSKPITIFDEKREEPAMYNSIFNQTLPLDELPEEEKEIGELLREQSSLVNFQIWYLRQKEWDAFLDNAFELTANRLRVHELDNLGIPVNLIIPIQDILKEEVFFRYIDEHNLEFQLESVTSSQYLVHIMRNLSGLVFLLLVMLFASEILSYESRHQSIMQGLPLKFMNKIHAKVMVSFLLIAMLLLIGVVLGGVYSSYQSSIGDFMAPVVIYLSGEYMAISTTTFLILLVGGQLIVLIFLLYLASLLNMLLKNAFATVVFGLSLFFIPDVFGSLNIDVPWLHTIKLIDIYSVLMGTSSVQATFTHIDYLWAMIYLVIATFVIILIIYTINKRDYLKKFSILHKERKA